MAMARPQRRTPEQSLEAVAHGASRRVSAFWSAPDGVLSCEWLPVRPGRSSAWAGTFAALALLMSACLRGGNGQAANAERRSESEYDVARDLFWGRRDARGALEHAQRATELDDENAEAHHLVALLYLYFCTTSTEECRLTDAERAARKAVAARSDFREARNTLGVVLTHEKKYDEAIAVLRPLAEDILYQTPWDAWGNLGLAYLEKGSVSEAIHALRKSVAAEPRFCVGNYRLGLAYEKKGELLAAREALTKAVETNRPECQALQDGFEARGRVLAKLKQCDLARGDWERCRQLSAESQAGMQCAAHLTSTPC